MCASMTDIQSVNFEIRQGKRKEEEEEEGKIPKDEDIMVCPIPHGDHSNALKRLAAAAPPRAVDGVDTVELEISLS